METQGVKTVLIGVGGYGATYLNPFVSGILDWKEMDLAGVVDPYAGASPHYQLLQDKKVPIYRALSDFYAEKNADLAVIASDRKSVV